MSVLGVVAAAAATAYAVKNRKHIAGKVADDVEEVKERAALSLYRRIGEPLYRYIKEKNFIPF
jgi:hypothetical protein